MTKKILLVFLLGLLLFFSKSLTNAQTSSIPECKEKNLDSNQCIDYLKNKVSEKQGQAKTLSSQIAIMDSQIRLTEARIEQNKKDILDLTLDIDTATKKISTLQDSLESLTEILINRIIATYEAGRVEPLEMFLTSSNASNLLLRFNYLKIIQAHDKKLVYEVQQAKNDYTNQKEIFEDKKKKIEALKLSLERFEAQLEREKRDKQALLEITKNDEVRYQQLLAQALAERKAIVAVFSQAVARLNSGEGEKIERGQTVGFIGNSGAPDCSTGSHLHFTILQNSSPIDPGQKLKNISVVWDNSPDGPSSLSGDWDWPISNPRITQSYGMTYWARLGWYGGNIHDGYDMTGDSTIAAPKSGKIIYGSTTCDNPNIAGVSTLKYSAVRHDDDPSIITLYLHIQ